MVRFVPAFIARWRLARYDAERYRLETRIERSAAREWTVTEPLRLGREDDYRGTLIELQPGTALRYEFIEYKSGHDYGGWHSTSRRFLVLDGEHAGARVKHIESAAEPFPPGLVPSNRPVEPGA